MIVKIQTEYFKFYPYDHFNHIKVNLIKPTPTSEKTVGEVPHCDMQGKEQTAPAFSTTQQRGNMKSKATLDFSSPHQYSLEDSTRICLIL